MSFFKDRASDIQAADLVVHTMLEGDGSLTENLDQLIKGVQNKDA